MNDNLIQFQEDGSFDKINSASGEDVYNKYANYRFCEVGQPIYYDANSNTVNKLSGEIILGYCVKNDDHKNPIFATTTIKAQDMYYRIDGYIRGLQSMYHIVLKTYDINLYVPSLSEIILAEELIDPDRTYWTSTKCTEHDNWQCVWHSHLQGMPMSYKFNIVLFFTINEKNDESVNESVDLMSIEDDDQPFEKSTDLHTLFKNKRLYNFYKCGIGDPLYYDESIGYNIFSGEEVGHCAVPAGQLDNQPRFICNDKNVSIYETKYDQMGWYRPSSIELIAAIQNDPTGFELSYEAFYRYYESNEEIQNKVVVVSKEGKAGTLLKCLRPERYMPFWKPIQDKVNESVQNLIQLDDEEQPFDKRSYTKDRLYDFKNAAIGEYLKYDDIAGLNMMVGDNVGICCITSGQIDSKPRFMSINDMYDEEYKSYKAPYLYMLSDIQKNYDFYYMPNCIEMMVATSNIQDQFDKDAWYWTQNGPSNYKTVIDVNGHGQLMGIDVSAKVRPFIKIS